MTNGLGLFLVFYVLVGQPALLGWMLNNISLYELAGLNGGVFIIALVISLICKSSRKKTNEAKLDDKVKLAEKSEEKVSRIENDSGVAIVEVEKKQEVIVETAKSDDEISNVEHENEKKEAVLENLSEKTQDKPMKEPVIIPKIVQPLSGHASQSKKRNREIRWGQRVILIVTLGLSAIIAWTLWEFLGNRGIAIALFLGWIIYLVIGKLFDVDGFYRAKNLFTNWLYVVLIVAGIGYGVYATQDDNSFNLIKDKAVLYVKNRFKSEKTNDFEANTGDVIYVFEGTGEVITDIEDNTEILDETGIIEDEIENTETDTGIVENIEPEIEVQPEPIVEAQTLTLSEEEAKKQVTMGEAIKSLVGGSTLSTKTNVSFKYVSKSNELYPYFKTAQEKWMIGTDTDPSKLVSCDTYITLKGLREGRNVGTYSKDNVKTVYWNKAIELGKLNGCEKGKYVTKGNL